MIIFGEIAAKQIAQFFYVFLNFVMLQSFYQILAVFFRAICFSKILKNTTSLQLVFENAIKKKIAVYVIF